MSLSSLRTSISLVILSLALWLPGSPAGAAAITDTAYVDFQANNCTIPAGKSMCPSTLYVTTYAGRTFNVTNLNRGITTSNLLTPNNYTTIPGSTSPVYTVSTSAMGDAANYISYGESNNLNLFEGTKLIARAITAARCVSGTIWNGQVCSTPGTSSPIACTMEAKMCPDGTAMPRNMNTCEWLPNQCAPMYPTDPLPPTLSSLSISCTKSTYFLGEAISCKIRGGSSIKTCWQTGKSAVAEKNCVEYGWIPDANGIDLTYNGTVTSWMLGNYNLYVRDAAGKTTFTQVKYSDGSAESNVRMDVKACTIESGKSRCAATVDVTAPAGKLFNLENVQRAVTSTNIIRPGVYTITTSVLGDDAANYLTYGVNDLVLKEGTLPVARASTNAVCAINTKWNGQICTASAPVVVNTGTTAVSKVTLKSGNGDTVFIDTLYPNISKNFYYPEQVTKSITVPSTTSVLNVTLSSSKAQCSVSPNYKTDNGTIFSNNAKVVSKTDLPNFSMSIPTSSVASQIGGVLYGKISTLTISCDTSTETVKDLLIYNINLSSTIAPTPLNFQANNCTIAIGKSTCVSTLYLTAPAGKYYSVKNATRGITTSNLLTPNNYIPIPGSSSPAYSVSSNVTGDAANYATYGDNDLVLYEGTSTAISLAKAVMNAACATGSTWNGQICKENIVTPPDTLLGQYKGYLGGSSTPFITTNNISRADALSNCKLNASNNPSQSIRCTWNDIEIYSSGVPPVETTKETVTCIFASSTTSQSCYTTIDGINFSCAGQSSCTVAVYGKKWTNVMWKSSLGGYLSTTLDAQDERITFTNSTTPPVIPVSLYAPVSCVIQIGASTCSVTTSIMGHEASKTYDLFNKTRGITTGNAFHSLNGFTFVPTYGDTAGHITYGNNILSVRNSGITTDLASVGVKGECASGGTWNGQICIKAGPVACTMEARLCDDGSAMPRNPNTCEWLPEQCMPVMYATHIGLSSYTVNDRVYDFTGNSIVINAGDILSLKGYGRPGALAYFWREGQVTTDSTKLSPTSGEWNLSNVWSPAGARIVIPGTYTYILSGLPPSTVPGTVMQSTQTAVRITVGTTTGDSYIDFQANNCTIAVGKSTCASTLYLTNPQGKIYTVKNITRGLTTTNLLTPNNYTTVPGSNYPTYSVSTHVTGDAANYATNGINELSLFDSTSTSAIALKKATMSATCASGSVWNGQMCATGIVTNPNVPKPTLTINRYPKVLGPGQNMTLSWSTTNATSFSYFCNGNGVVANKKVSLDLNKATYGVSWDMLRSEGWNGVYECEFTAMGPNGSTSVKDIFAILPQGSAGIPGSTYTDFQANNCTIPAGKSLCASALYITAPAGKYYSMKNVTRGITTSNLLTENNYTFITGFNSPVYTVKENILGDASNYAKFGINEFTLYDGTNTTIATARATMEASCASGSIWNGQICTSGVTTPPTNTPKPMLFVERNPKILGPGKNMTLSWSTTNATSLSYFCSGTGPQANKKVTIALNSTPYSEAWDKLISDGWTGTYECDFIAVGPGGSTVVADSFTITPRSTIPNPIPDPTPYTDFQANNCIIQANKSTCISSIFVRAAAGKYFHVTNSTRGLTTLNLLNPTNYVSVIGSTTPMYMATSHVTGDAANYITYGVNDLILKEGTTVISKAVASAECVKGTSWNGKMCVAGGGVACTDVVKYCEDGSIMPRDPNCGWLPGQCGGKTAQPLAIACSKSTYTIGEAISCKISGGIGTKSCWQLGTKSTDPKSCTDLGWNDDGGTLYYYSSVSTSMIGEYVLYTKDSQGNIASTKVSYINPTTLPPASSTVSFEASSCSIPAGQNKCASTLLVKAPAGKIFSVSNLSRGITTSNLITPNNSTSIPGTNISTYTVSTHITGDAANYITYGESNTLNLLEGKTVIAHAIASAKCNEGTTWNGKACIGSKPVNCNTPSNVLVCSNGTVMPRDPLTCEWLPSKCPTDTTEINPLNPVSPTKPYGIPTIKVLNIGGVLVNPDNYVAISKTATEPLKVKGEITSIRSGYTIKLTGNKSDYYTTMPVSPNGVWGTDQTPTPDIYQSRIVAEGDNLLTFSLIDDSTKATVAQTFVKVRVTFVRGISITPICVMAAGSTGTCLPPPTTPTYPNCPRTTTSSSAASSSSLIYCPPDDGTEINPTNTINPKPPVTKPPTTSTGIRVPIEQPTIPPCSSAGGNSLTIGCINPAVDVVIVDGLPTKPIEEALDAASRKRIDTIIARTRSRVADMSTTDALAFIDSSIKRIQDLPNKTAKAKLIDAYTLSRLQSLRNTIKSSSANNPADDYIGLVDNVLSN